MNILSFEAPTIGEAVSKLSWPVDLARVALEGAGNTVGGAVTRSGLVAFQIGDQALRSTERSITGINERAIELIDGTAALFLSALERLDGWL